jgi:hypothetical protein
LAHYFGSLREAEPSGARIRDESCCDADFVRRPMLGVGGVTIVVLDEFVELLRNPIGVTRGAPRLLATFVDEGGAMLPLLFRSERHMTSV